MFWQGIAAALAIDVLPVYAVDSGCYYFVQSEDALAQMQDTYWNGTYWPTTIQWIGALIDTVVASTERTFTAALSEDNARVPGCSTTASDIDGKINKYFSQIEQYYEAEDTNQIFDAAYDDAQWVVLEWLEVIKFRREYDADSKRHDQVTLQDFAHRAHIFYNIVQNKYDTSLCEGGITWNPALATYKNAITNELFVSSSIAMYLYFPGDDDPNPYPSPTYQSTTNTTLPPLPTLSAHDPMLLENAKREWAWFRSHNFTNSQGLIVDGFHISDGQTSCDERNEMVYTYNQGVILSGLRGLWEATGDTAYLQDGYDLINTAINATGWQSKTDVWAGLGRNGIMEDYCDAPANCSQDNLIFKGAYFEHLDLFCEPLPTSTPLVDGLTYLANPDLANSHSSRCEGYVPWVQHNADAALSTRDSSGVMGEWWTASTVNKTQSPAPKWAPRKPKGATDIWNQPWLLSSPPWQCSGQHGCLGFRRRSRGAENPSEKLIRRRSSGQTRTVETQAQGLSVVKAAANLMAKRQAYGERS